MSGFRPADCMIQFPVAQFVQFLSFLPLRFRENDLIMMRNRAINDRLVKSCLRDEEGRQFVRGPHQVFQSLGIICCSDALGTDPIIVQVVVDQEPTRAAIHIEQLAAAVAVSGVMDKESFIREMRTSYEHKFAKKPEVIEGNMRALTMTFEALADELKKTA